MLQPVVVMAFCEVGWEYSLGFLAPVPLEHESLVGLAMAKSTISFIIIVVTFTLDEIHAPALGKLVGFYFFAAMKDVYSTIIWASSSQLAHVGSHTSRHSVDDIGMRPSSQDIFQSPGFFLISSFCTGIQLSSATPKLWSILDCRV